MPPFRFLCLVNSRKWGERCIAGLNLDTGRWIRPVGKTEHGELSYSQRNLGIHGEPQNFDVIRVNLSKAAPTSIQPENWILDSGAWTLIERPAPCELHKMVREALYRGNQLFDSYSDRIPAITFSSKPAKESLLLVKPEQIRWLTDSLGMKRKARVLFRVSYSDYTLAVTDPVFEDRLTNLTIGYHSSKELGITNENRILFTISLGEPFEGNCYKLVAGVLFLPEAWPDL